MHVDRLTRKGSVYGGPEITLSGRRRRGSLAGRTASGVNLCMGSGALLSSDSSAWELRGAAHQERRRMLFLFHLVLCPVILSF